MRQSGVLLPGYACTSQIWKLLCDELGAEYDLTVVDWPLQSTPDFHGLSDFSDWLYEAYWPRQCDFVIGHSMGGLVALQLAASGKIAVPNIILIESFLVSPPPFFQNLVLDESSSTLSQSILTMLDQNKKYYSPTLREELRDIDMSREALDVETTLSLLYGDRGCGMSETVLRELQWSSNLKAHMNVSVIQDACHFPMLENPKAVAQKVSTIINS